MIRGGRRGGKSSTVCRIAVAEILNEKHNVPPGDIGIFAIISATKEQAKERLKTCGQILSALGIAHHQTAESITLDDRPTGIRCFAGTLRAAVSFTSIGALADEIARWQDEDGANPAKEILASLRPTAATMPHAQFWLVSSPWSVLDEHHRMMAAGDGPSQRVFTGTTWQMNPSLTEADTRALEPDEPTWSREYAAVPMASEETAFFSYDFIDQAAVAKHEWWACRVERTVAGADFAFTRNSSALVVLERRNDFLRLTNAEERIPGIKGLVPSVTIKEFGRIASDLKADSVSCDAHYWESVREHLEDFPLDLVPYPSSTDNAPTYVRTRVLLSEGKLDLSRAPKKLLDQLKNTTAQPTAAGGLTIKNKTVAGAHGDMVSALICAVWSIDQLPLGDKVVTGPRRFGATREPEEKDFPDMPGWP